MSQDFVLHAGDANRDNVKANLHTFIDRLRDDVSWEFRIQRHVKRRTDDQNHALFGVAYPPLIEATGFTKDELHEAFCKRHFGTVEREIFGQLRTVPFRTTTRDEHGKADKISAEEFARFYDMVQQVGAEAGIFVPSPDPMKKRGVR